MTENERLREIRKALGLTQKDLSAVLQIKQGSYSDVERGKAGISALLLKNLIRKFRINPLWLTDGEGSMFIGQQYIDLDKALGDNQKNKVSGSLQVHLPKSTIQNPDAHIDLLERQKQQLENVNSIISFLSEDQGE